MLDFGLQIITLTTTNALETLNFCYKLVTIPPAF